MTTAQEEIFGPAASATTYEDRDDAIRTANDSIHGLNGAVFTNDVEQASDVARGVRTSIFDHNRFEIDFAVPRLGFQAVGVEREGRPDGLLPFLGIRTVHLPRVPENLRREVLARSVGSIIIKYDL